MQFYRHGYITRLELLMTIVWQQRSFDQFKNKHKIYKKYKKIPLQFVKRNFQKKIRLNVLQLITINKKHRNFMPLIENVICI